MRLVIAHRLIPQASTPGCSTCNTNTPANRTVRPAYARPIERNTSRRVAAPSRSISASAACGTSRGASSSTRPSAAWGLGICGIECERAAGLADRFGAGFFVVASGGRDGARGVLGGELASPSEIAIAVEVRLDAVGDLSRGRTLCRIGGGRACTQIVELGRDVAVALRSGDGSARASVSSSAAMPRGNADSPVEDLVEDAAERVDVGAAVDRVVAQLFGRHVAGRAEHGAGRGLAARAARR